MRRPVRNRTHVLTAATIAVTAALTVAVHSHFFRVRIDCNSALTAMSVFLFIIPYVSGRVGIGTLPILLSSAALTVYRSYANHRAHSPQMSVNDFAWKAKISGKLIIRQYRSNPDHPDQFVQAFR